MLRGSVGGGWLIFVGDIAVVVRQIRKRDFLHRVVEVVGAGLGGSERLAAGTVLRPEEAAARVGVGDE